MNLIESLWRCFIQWSYKLLCFWCKPCHTIQSERVLHKSHNFTWDMEIIKFAFNELVNPNITSVIRRPDFLSVGHCNILPVHRSAEKSVVTEMPSLSTRCVTAFLLPCISMFSWFKWWKASFKKQTVAVLTRMSSRSLQNRFNVFPLLTHLMSLWMS